MQTNLYCKNKYAAALLKMVMGGLLFFSIVACQTDEQDTIPEEPENRTLMGTISNAQNGQPLSLVQVESSLANAVSGSNGQFKIKATDSDSLYFSKASFWRHVEAVNGRNQVDVKLEPLGEIPAFPGAEGFGRYTTGGRNGKVIYVTTLEDNGTKGSFRSAVQASGPRIILFKVSGTIRLKSRLTINQGDLTIAGQSAPGDGICIADYPVVINADNIIIRYMRFRPGDVTGQEADGLEARFHKNIMIDHCSVSWSTDECLTMYANENTTVQWCIIAESLRESVHGKGAHGYGGIWGGRFATFHHNLLAHHDSRNPRLGEEAGKVFALTDLVDLRNNVIYNWRGNSAYGGEGMNVNIVNCYYKPGPETTKKERIVSIDKNTDPDTEIFDQWGKFYIDGNVLEGSSRATEDNWTFGVYNQIHNKYGTISEADKKSIRQDQPHGIDDNVVTHTAEEAYDLVLRYAGASYHRDAADQRVINDVTSGGYTATGSLSDTKGIIDSPSDAGGWPELQTLPAPVDGDGDGIPDDWEQANGLDPDNPEDGMEYSIGRSYPNLEIYLNSLVEEQ